MLFIPLRWPVFIILAECPFNWSKSSLSDAKLAEGLLSQPSVFGWKIIFEATLAWAMQTFQRPTASKVLNNSWQNEKTRDNSKQGNKSNTLENHPSCYDKGPGIHEIQQLYWISRGIANLTAYLPDSCYLGLFGLKESWDMIQPLDTVFWGAEFSASDSKDLGESKLSTLVSGSVTKMVVTHEKSTVLNSERPKFPKQPPTDEGGHLTGSSDIVLYKSFLKT